MAGKPACGAALSAGKARWSARPLLQDSSGALAGAFRPTPNRLFQGTNVTVDGQRQKLGTGDILEGGVGEGVATSADMVSKYLIERAEQYQPVIEMPTGIDVEIVFLEGVFISG